MPESGFEPPNPLNAARPWQPWQVALLGVLADEAVGKIVGRTTVSVARYRQRLGIPSGGASIREVARKGPWQPGDVALLGVLPDEALGKIMGRTTAAVTRYRQRLGIPAQRTVLPVTN